MLCEELSSALVNVCVLAIASMPSSCMSLGAAQSSMRSTFVSSGNTIQVVHIFFLQSWTQYHNWLVHGT